LAPGVNMRYRVPMTPLFDNRPTAPESLDAIGGATAAAPTESAGDLAQLTHPMGSDKPVGISREFARAVALMLSIVERQSRDENNR
jgi:hypothetical protein